MEIRGTYGRVLNAMYFQLLQQISSKECSEEGFHCIFLLASLFKCKVVVFRHKYTQIFSPLPSTDMRLLNKNKVILFDQSLNWNCKEFKSRHQCFILIVGC